MKIKKFSKTQAAVTAAATALAMAPAIASAHAEDDYGTSAVATSGFLLGSAIFFFGLIAVGIASLVLWIVMLIDCLQRQNWKDDNQKNTWLIVLIVSWVVGLPGLAALVYYFVVRKPLGKASSKSTAKK